jgi:uncharacterized protein YecE (DUF72 family)
MTVRIGTSGWAYREWRGTYYPDGLAQRRQLGYLAGRLSSLELNGSFYSLRRPATYRSWRTQVPDPFLFAVKGHRFVTHLRRLREPHAPLANFLASGVLELGDKLGPLLWQFPPNLAFDPALLADFLAALPRDTTAAARLAREHATMTPAEGPVPEPAPAPLRHAVEVRHETFRADRCYELLRDHGVALVTADTAGRFLCLEERTADFRYVRLHGATELYVSSYRGRALTEWADRISEWADGGDVYVYFDNTATSAAPRNAERLAKLVRPSVPA